MVRNKFIFFKVIRRWFIILLVGLLLVDIESKAAIVHVAPDTPFAVPMGTLFDPVFYDLNGDGVDDLAMGRGGIQTSSGAVNGSRLVADATKPSYNADMTGGDFIGMDLADSFLWDAAGLALNVCASGGGAEGCFGNFLGGREYMGLEFQISGEAHYGWVQIESSPFTTGALIVDWAYESEPGVGIIAGQIPEPSVGLMTLLGLGLVCVRRRR